MVNLKIIYTQWHTINDGGSATEQTFFSFFFSLFFFYKLCTCSGQLESLFHRLVYWYRHPLYTLHCPSMDPVGSSIYNKERLYVSHVPNTRGHLFHHPSRYSARPGLWLHILFLGNFDRCKISELSNQCRAFQINIYHVDLWIWAQEINYFPTIC